MLTYTGIPYAHSRDENTNGNLALAAPVFDEEKLLVYRELYFDGFSTVIAARDLSSGAAVAIKKIDFSHLANCFSGMNLLQKRISNKLRKQTAQIKEISHPAVMKMLDFVLEPRRFIVITEMCLFGDLFNWMLQQQAVRLRDVFLIIQGIFQAFQFLHGKGYIHGSLKPTSILFQTISAHSLVILPDISTKKEIAYLMNDPLLHCTSCFAPEALIQMSTAGPPLISFQSSEDEFAQMFGTKAMDVWSIGVIALIALTGVNHFEFNSINEMKLPLNEKLNKAFSNPIFKFCDPKISDYLRRFLQIDPMQRSTAVDGAAINWLDESNCSEDEHNLLYLMEYDLMNTCKYFRLYGQNVIKKIGQDIRK